MGDEVPDHTCLKLHPPSLRMFQMSVNVLRGENMFTTVLTIPLHLKVSYFVKVMLQQLYFFCFFSINALLLFFLRHSNQEVVEVTFRNSFRLCPQRGASNPCNRGNSRNFCRKQRRRSPQDNASSDCLLHIHPYTLLCKYTYTRHTIHKSFSELNRLQKSFLLQFSHSVQYTKELEQCGFSKATTQGSESLL